MHPLFKLPRRLSKKRGSTATLAAYCLSVRLLIISINHGWPNACIILPWSAIRRLFFYHVCQVYVRTCTGEVRARGITVTRGPRPLTTSLTQTLNRWVYCWMRSFHPFCCTISGLWVIEMIFKQKHSFWVFPFTDYSLQLHLDPMFYYDFS